MDQAATIGLGLCIAFIFFCIVQVPIFGIGPVWLREIFARIARTLIGKRCYPKAKHWNWTQIEPLLYLGTVPTTAAQLEELKAEGIGAVLTLTQRWEPQIKGGVHKVCTAQGLRNLTLATPDYSAPSQSALSEAAAFIDTHVREGRGVYVHCNGGKGRSTCCLIAYLISVRSMSALEAFRYIQSKRKVARLLERPLGIPRPQWRAVLSYEASVRGGGISSARHASKLGNTARVMPASSTDGQGAQVVAARAGPLTAVS